jgi:hypothetical protein
MIYFMQRVVRNKLKYFVSKLGRMLAITCGRLSEPQRTVDYKVVKRRTLPGDW